MAHGAPVAGVHAAAEAVDCFVTLQTMMHKLLASAPELLQQLDGATTNSARCQMLNIDDEFGTVKKCLFTVVTTAPEPTVPSSYIITEIPAKIPVSQHNTLLVDTDIAATPNPCISSEHPQTDMIVDAETARITQGNNPDTDTVHVVSPHIAPSNTVTPAGKRKKVTVPVNQIDLRRSRRLAGLSVGFKDQAVANRAQLRINQFAARKDLFSAFDYEINDPSAPAPPELLVSTIQAIATKKCQIPPREVSTEALTSTSHAD